MHEWEAFVGLSVGFTGTPFCCNSVRFLVADHVSFFRFIRARNSTQNPSRTFPVYCLPRVPACTFIYLLCLVLDPRRTDAWHAGLEIQSSLHRRLAGQLEYSFRAIHSGHDLLGTPRTGVFLDPVRCTIENLARYRLKDPAGPPLNPGHFPVGNIRDCKDQQHRKECAQKRRHAIYDTGIPQHAA